MYNRESLRVKKKKIFLYYLVLLSKILVWPKSPYTSVQTVQVKGHCRIRTNITLMSEDGERYSNTNRDQYKGPPICLEFGAINKGAEYGEGGFVVHEAALKGSGT